MARIALNGLRRVTTQLQRNEIPGIKSSLPIHRGAYQSVLKAHRSKGSLASSQGSAGIEGREQQNKPMGGELEKIRIETVRLETIRQIRKHKILANYSEYLEPQGYRVSRKPEGGRCDAVSEARELASKKPVNAEQSGAPGSREVVSGRPVDGLHSETPGSEPVGRGCDEISEASELVPEKSVDGKHGEILEKPVGGKRDEIPEKERLVDRNHDEISEKPVDGKHDGASEKPADGKHEGVSEKLVDGKRDEISEKKPLGGKHDKIQKEEVADGKHDETSEKSADGRHDKISEALEILKVRMLACQDELRARMARQDEAWTEGEDMLDLHEKARMDSSVRQATTKVLHWACIELARDYDHMCQAMEEYALRDRRIQEKASDYINKCRWGALTKAGNHDSQEILRVITPAKAMLLEVMLDTRKW